MPNLDSTTTFPTSGSMPSGSSSWSSFGGGGSSGGDGSSFDWAGLGKVAAPFVASAFGPGNPYKGDLNTLATQAMSAGTADKAAGTSALAPVLKYLQAIVGGDPTAVMEATAPQRARIIDQYDTARKAITQQPRGGGQASGALNLEAKKASDLATTASSARSDAVKEAGSIGTSLFQTGAQEQSSARDTAMRAFQSLSQGQDKSNAEIGSAIGAALPFILAFL